MERYERLEIALYKWLYTIDEIEKDVLDLLDNKNIAKSKIAKDMDKMETKLNTLKINLKNYN